MADEQYDKYEGQDEGEYHFSDDQANYEMEIEQPKGPAVVTTSSKENILDRLKSRKVIVPIVVFIVVIAGVYKFLGPSSAPPTDFDQSSTTPTQVTANPPTKAPAAPTPPSVASTSQQPAPTPPATKQAANNTAVEAPKAPQQPIAPVAQAPQAIQNPIQQPLTAQNPIPPSPLQNIMQPPPPVPLQNPMPQAPVASQGPTTTNFPRQTGDMQSRVGSSEQQEQNVIAMLQTQKDLENQNTQLRLKVDELNTRIASMETAFHQLTALLRGRHMESAGPRHMRSLASVPTRPIQPRISYTVQAIIPGRAWLKSDSGETVTVAEGDMLKGYGRVSKIDPYDGIVDIDMGNKIVTLAYGTSGD